MLIAHKITLDLNNCQATYMARAAGTGRFAYNWALAEWTRQYEAWKLDNTLPKPSTHCPSPHKLPCAANSMLSSMSSFRGCSK